MAPSQAEPEPGDLIEIFRFGYTHWALYVGDGYVVHLGPPGDITGAALAKLMSSGTERAVVKKQLLSVVAGEDKYRVNNENDDKYSPLPPSEIVRHAEEKVGQEVHYKLTSENCEHFVNELRYGVHRSNQVIEAVLAVALVIFGAAFGPVVGIPAGVAAGFVVTAVAIKGVLRYLWNRPKHAKR